MAHREKYGMYMEEIKSYERYFQGGETPIVDEDWEQPLHIKRSSALSGGSFVEEGKQDGKHEREIIEIRQQKLISRLTQEKSKMGLVKLSALDLSQNHIGLKFLKVNKQLIGDFIRASMLQELNLSHNQIDTQAMEELRKALLNQNGAIHKLKSLNLRHNMLENDSYIALLPFILSTENIDLSENPLRDTFFQNLFLILSSEQNEEPFCMQTLAIQNCSLSKRSINILTHNFQRFPKLEKLDYSFNEFEDSDQKPSFAVLEFNKMILERQRSIQLGNVMQVYPKNMKESKPNQALSDKALQLNDMNELNSIKFILQQTHWLLSPRILTLTQTKVSPLFPEQSHIIARFLNLYSQNVVQLQATKAKTGASGGGFELTTTQLEIQSLQLSIIQLFRESMLKGNICYFDMSMNHMSENSLLQGLNLLKICSHKLKVLKLDGNHLTPHSLQTLYNIIESAGLNHMEYLSMSNCGLKCTCDKEPSSQCQISTLSKIIQSQQHLHRLDISMNYNLGQNSIKHLFLEWANKSLISLNLAGCFTEIEDFHVLRENLTVMTQVIEAEFIAQHILYNPTVVQYVKQELDAMVNENRRSFLQKHFRSGLRNIEEQIFEYRYCIIDEKPVKCIDDLIFFSKLQPQSPLIQQCLNIQTQEKFTLIAKEHTIPNQPNRHYLKFIGKTRLMGNISTLYNLYEPFSFSLLDCIIDLAKPQRVSQKLSKIKLSHTLLDFYESYNINNQLIHPSQLVLVPSNSDTGFTYSIKILPIENALTFKETHDKDIENAMRSLNEFLDIENDARVQLYKVLGLWRHLFSVYCQREGRDFDEEAGVLIRAMNNKVADGHYSKKNLQRMIVVMTVIDDIFEVKAHFKKRHTQTQYIVRQIDKLLLRFYLKVKEYAAIGDEIDEEDLNYVLPLKDTMKDAHRLYLRISQMLI